MSSNIRAVPMSTDELQELFLNPEISFQIDVGKSKLRGESFITYLSNMRMKCSLLESDTLPYEDKEEILKSYIKNAYFTDCRTLLESLAYVMFLSRDIPVEPLSNWLSVEESKKFIQNNNDIIKNISDFLDSCLVAIASLNVEFKKNFLDPSLHNKDINLIEDPDIVCINVLGLLTLPNFIEYFISFNPQPEKKLSYYKYQVEKFTYNKKFFFQILVNLSGDSLLLSLVNIFFSPNEDAKNILKKYSEITGV